MGLILQMQRRTIESLSLHLAPLELKSGQRFFLAGIGEVFFRGFSVGEGTCSDRHGVNFAVFSAFESDSPDIDEAVRRLRPRFISGAVFLRAASRDERQANFGDAERENIMTVEALMVKESHDEKVFLNRVGTKSSYVRI